MKMCQPHWDKLRKAIDDRGLTKHVSIDGEEAAKKLVEGKPDPLMSAHNTIMTAAITASHGQVLINDCCPLCELDKECKKRGSELMSDDWINGASDDVQKEFQLEN